MGTSRECSLCVGLVAPFIEVGGEQSLDDLVLLALVTSSYLLENHFLPGDLENQIDAFIVYYNHQRYHESLKNLPPADVYFGRGQIILMQRERIKRQTIQNRRLLHSQKAA
jgi:hypothetical protein